MQELNQIYDRIFKRIFSMSHLSIINLINGLFQTNYPPDSKVTFPNKESHNSKLRRKYADIFVTINDQNTYHLEAQMQKDKNIVMRVFEYGYFEAIESREDDGYIKFPDPVIIYLSKETGIPEESCLQIDFGKQGIFYYKVKNYVYLDHDVIELNQKKMILLIPFQLLKLRNQIDHDLKNGGLKEEHIDELKKLIQNDIVGSISANLQVGNILVDDAKQLIELVNILFHHIYEKCMESRGVEEVSRLLEGAIELPGDELRSQIWDLEDQLDEEKKKTDKEKLKVQKMQEENDRLRKEIELLKAKK